MMRGRIWYGAGTAAQWLFVVLLCVLAGCAQQPYGAAGYAAYAPTHYYPPPGPPGDPWGPYIQEAATRFSIPGQWIRAVMAQESGGEEQAVSPVGAMGLMQIMPETYQALEAQYGLGADPFNPEDNILAGAAYIREMYGKYGSPGFLAAYNAGPEAVDSYLAGEGQLPDETVNYLAAVTPNLGGSVPFSGPLANYEVASAGSGAGTPTVASFATGCDVNAAYDPEHPCTAQMADNIVVAEQSAGGVAQSASGACNLNGAYNPDDPCAAGASGGGSCNLNLAYDPSAPCAPANPGMAVPAPEVANNETLAAPAPLPQDGGSALYQPAPAPEVMQAVALPAAASGGSWAIQVGAFSSAGLARVVATGARAELPGVLSGAAIETPATAPFGGLTLYRARLVNLSQQGAANACQQLNARQLPCIVVRASAA